MTTTQLRRYQLPLDHELQDSWLEWWRSVCEPRKQHGFRILFAHLDREAGQFTWAVAHDGDDFGEAERAYVASPERLELLTRPRPEIEVLHVAVVDVVA